MQYYQFHIGDYVSSTVHLQPLEDLAYRRLIDLYYDTEQPIPNDIPWVSRRLRLGSEEIEFVLSEFFELTENGWENHRCNEEIAKFNAWLTKQRANGKKGGRPQKRGKKNPPLTHGKPTANPPLTHGVPSVKPPITHNPITNYHNDNTPLPPQGGNDRQTYPEQFNEVWKIYGRKGSKKQSLAQWKKLSEDDKDAAVKAIRDYQRERPERQFRKDFQRYLRDREFEAVLERAANGCLDLPPTNNTEDEPWESIQDFMARKEQER